MCLHDAPAREPKTFSTQAVHPNGTKETIIAVVTTDDIVSLTNESYPDSPPKRFRVPGAYADGGGAFVADFVKSYVKPEETAEDQLLLLLGLGSARLGAALEKHGGEELAA